MTIRILALPWIWTAKGWQLFGDRKSYWRWWETLKAWGSSEIELRPAACLACNVTHCFRHSSLDVDLCGPWWVEVFALRASGTVLRCLFSFSRFLLSFCQLCNSKRISQNAPNCYRSEMSARIFHIGCLKSEQVWTYWNTLLPWSFL